MVGPGGRPSDCVVDVSADETGSSRGTAVLASAAFVTKAWQNNMIPQMPTQYRFDSARFIDLDSVDGISGTLGPQAGAPTVGTAVLQVSSPGVAFLFHKVCAHNRSQRAGRMYFPGVGENMINDDGTVTGSYVTALNTNVGAFLTAVHAGVSIPPTTLAWRVVHVAGHDGVVQPGFPQGKPNAWTSSDVNSVYVDPKIATQRRRLRK